MDIATVAKMKMVWDERLLMQQRTKGFRETGARPRKGDRQLRLEKTSPANLFQCGFSPTWP